MILAAWQLAIAQRHCWTSVQCLRCYDSFWLTESTLCWVIRSAHQSFILQVSGTKAGRRNRTNFSRLLHYSARTSDVWFKMMHLACACLVIYWYISQYDFVQIMCFAFCGIMFSVPHHGLDTLYTCTVTSWHSWSQHLQIEFANNKI